MLVLLGDSTLCLQMVEQRSATWQLPRCMAYEMNYQHYFNAHLHTAVAQSTRVMTSRHCVNHQTIKK